MREKEAMRLTVVVLAVLALLGAAVPAGAQTAVFLQSGTSASLQGSNLTVSFSLTGLTSGITSNVVVTGTEQASYVCLNKAGKVPAASNKSTSSTVSMTSIPFTGSTTNGTLTGSLSVTPMTAQQIGLDCPGGLTSTLQSVTFSNLVITDQTTHATMQLPGTFTYVNASVKNVH